LLDGFDEVEPSFRDVLAKQIIQLSYEFGGNAIVLTSRPDGPFGSWNEFYIAKMCGFTKKQTISLVSKMEYEGSAKKDFLVLIKKGLFESHQNYLSNPLLCTLMLLTFNQGAEIPSKMHVFFERAFDVLFYKHDATKETSFRRKFRTSLAIDDFRSVFAAFSAFCYLDYGSSFNHADANASARQALAYNELKEDPEAFISDLCISISILIREGDKYNYIHRSLQEFFVAQFLAYREIDDWGSVVQHILIERPNDTVISLLSDINRDRFEKQFLAPRIRQMRVDLEEIDISETPAAAFLLFNITFSFGEYGIGSWTFGRAEFRCKWHFMLQFVSSGSAVDSAYARVDEFDWSGHCQDLGVETMKAEGAVGSEIVEVTDGSLLRTPMIDYLQKLKSAVIALDDKLTMTAANQKRLVSTALLKK
jgi:hypothetical protein